MTSWVDNEIGESKFRDGRLGKRFLKLVKNLSERIGDSVPVACQDWASIKAAYRFFSNPNLSESEILSGHFNATKMRCEEIDGPILVLHDTTEIPYNRKNVAAIGAHRVYENKQKRYGWKENHKCGILMHPSLAITPEGLPLGLANNIFWSRKKFKNSREVHRKKNTTRIPITDKESYRWIQGLEASNRLLGDPKRIVHVADREGDIYEFFQAAVSQNSHFLVRSKTNRRTDSEEIQKVHDVMESADVKGSYEIKYRDKNGEDVDATLEIKFERMAIRPSTGLKRNSFPDTEVTVIYAKEIGKTRGSRDPIDWRLITDLEVKTLEDSIEKIQCYALRWRIERYFFILKSGCKIEELKLRTAGALYKLISIYCIIAWRIFWMTMINRESESLSAKVALTPTEIKTLDQLKPSKTKAKPVLSDYVIKIAKLGGYIGRNSDPPPGNKVIWKGMERLADILIGVEVGMKLVGN